MVAAGFVLAKRLKVDREAVATLLVYVLAPAVVFYGVATAPVDNTYLLLPLLFFVVGSLLAMAFYAVGGLIWQGSERNLLGYTAGTGNTGYFGLPLVFALLGARAQSVAILAILGVILYENTVGYYFIAKSHLSMRQALLKVAHLPALYAFALGLIVNRLGWSLGAPLTQAFVDFRGAFVVLGMMVIGLGLATVTRAALDGTFTLMAFGAKFLVYPVVIALLVALDSNVAHIFDVTTHRVVLLLAVTPLASSTVVFATQLRVQPEKAAFTVVLSTLFALGFIPVFVALFFQ
jgi:predicted permease